MGNREIFGRGRRDDEFGGKEERKEMLRGGWERDLMRYKEALKS